MSEILIQGEFGAICKDGTVLKDETNQGFIYKNYKAYETGEGICYIPELCGT